jgi:WD40 repeat protein
VKVSKILPESDLLLTGSLDRRLSLWNLQTGTMLASSLQHAGTVRTLAVDDSLLVTGSSDHRIRVWKPRRNTSAEDEEDNEGQYANQDQQQQQQQQQHLAQHQRRQRDFPFDLGGPRTVLAGGHTGPVTSLQLTPTVLFSGSWDYCVRVWDRNCTIENNEEGIGGGGNVNVHTTSDINSSLRCIHVLHFNDMVSDMAFKGEKLFVANGTVVTQVDAGAGGGLQVVSSLQHHDGDATITAVEVSEDERCVFYSTSEGGIYASDVREPKGWSDSGYGRGSHGAVGTNCTMFKEILQHDVRNRVCGGPLIHKHMVSCSSPVTGLSWDYPWLAASLQNGDIVLLNAETTLLGGYGGAIGSDTTSNSISGRVSSRRGGGAGQQQQWYSRVLNAGGAPGAAQCVDISGKWLVAGFESGNVASWDFSRAEEADRAAEAIRVGRRKKREQRRQNASTKNNKNKSQQQQKKKEQQQGGGNDQARTEDINTNGDAPPPRQTDQQQQPEQQQQAPRSSSGGGNGGGGGRESWHVLGMARTTTPTE